ncbi:uncharacterized protein PV09_08099 [Verruconis gallopava]|uniref:Anaphase-promoting complex subunit 2 n=1 Tax=Verruconis gallopava TaxID=253628 RepID=A0A0D2A238_9PEZI|nr:uncharacterized protein PV09_08099 [Verruconis gallopava]KIW00390.1 hypothetical protein PV09_08099 [Verruconis gallopava]
MSSETDVFSSVFGLGDTVHTSPTPLSTPLLGAPAPGQSFGGPETPPGHRLHSAAAQLQVRKNLAWSTATRHLSLEGVSIDDLSSAGAKHVVTRRRKTRDVEEAIELLLGSDENASSGDWDLVGWYTLEVRTHFLETVAPRIAEAWSQPVTEPFVLQALEDTVLRLSQVQELYTGRLRDDLLPAIASRERRRRSGSSQLDSSSWSEQSVRVERTFLAKLHALFLHAFPAQKLSSALSYAMYSVSKDIFGFELREDEPSKASKPITDTVFFSLLEQLQSVGLGDDFGQRAFATAMWHILDDFVTGHWMKVDWERHQPRTKTLSRFISHAFTPFTRKCIALLGGTPDEVCSYHKMAVARLGRERIAHLFDYVVRWDESLGAVRDIKEYITTPEARLFLTSKFTDQVQRRLLHAGATTTHILNLYINIIHAFNELDPKGVLLDRIARPIRRYLRQREDTARIIVTSLLADLDEDGKPTTDTSGGTDISIAIAKEMTKPIVGLDADEDHDMDWDNMDWTPDPVDAGPDFKRSKSQDVTSALLSLYDREDFISELKTILGEHLLRSYDVNEHFEKEERLLELFKNRLGEEKLQACEVMLRDVQSSLHMNRAIHRFPAYTQTHAEVGKVELNAHILSSFFWPSLRDDDFRVPEPIVLLQKRYEEAFEAVKDTRKLRWMTALGRVVVELEFEDRKFDEEVPTWTASVIYAFQSADAGEGDTAPVKSVQQLEDELEMDEALVRNALTFWRGKQVLKETAPDTYTVIENLSAVDHQSTGAPVSMPVEDDAAVSAVKSQQDLLSENAELYRTFIVGMLTNQGNLPLMRIFMMLKVVVPGGFPFGMEEVRTLLKGLVEEGRLVGQGDVYGMKRN